ATREVDFARRLARWKLKRLGRRITPLGPYALERRKETREWLGARDANGAIRVLRQDELLTRLDPEIRRNAHGRASAVLEGLGRDWHRGLVVYTRSYRPILSGNWIPVYSG